MNGSFFTDQDGVVHPFPLSREIAEFIWVVATAGTPRIKTEPEDWIGGNTGGVIAQFPTAGTLVGADSEVILQFNLT
jgi:hypothetical protein